MDRTYRSRYRWATWAMLAVAATSCTKGLNQPMRTQEPPSEVKQIWDGHMATLERILARGSFTQQDYLGAVEFFEAVTGLPCHDDGTYMGRMPTSSLGEDVAAWKKWYTEHGHTLRLDPTSGHVRSDAQDGASM